MSSDDALWGLPFGAFLAPKGLPFGAFLAPKGLPLGRFSRTGGGGGAVKEYPRRFASAMSMGLTVSKGPSSKSQITRLEPGAVKGPVP
jgi:hypothetical protein